MTMVETFEDKAVLFKQLHAKSKKFDIKKIILLDNQSTVDLFCNHDMVENIRECV